MSNQFNGFDNLYDRSSLYSLLARLGDGYIGNRRRKIFLQWCCNQCYGRMMKSIDVKPDTVGTSLEVYIDITGLATAFGLDLTMVTDVLEKLVSTLEKRKTVENHRVSVLIR